MAPQDDLTAERAAEVHKTLMLLYGCPAGRECDYPAAYLAICEHDKTTRQEALRDVLSDLDSLHWKDHWYADQLRRKINERLL